MASIQRDNSHCARHLQRITEHSSYEIGHLLGRERTTRLFVYGR